MPYPENLKKSLKKYSVDNSVIDEIYEGYEDINDKSSKVVKLPFMRRAMKILDQKLSYDRRYEVIDNCSCCLGGIREKNVKKFSKDIEKQNLTLEEKVKLLREAHPFENYATCLNDDGTISDGIYYKVGDKYKCACPCLGKENLIEPISSTYCLCCAGHFRRHIQNALGIKLKTKEVISSAIESMEQEPCSFSFEIIK